MPRRSSSNPGDEAAAESRGPADTGERAGVNGQAADPGESRRPQHQAARSGPLSQFGDGDGSYWDRWLIAEPPSTGSRSVGFMQPRRKGFKRPFQPPPSVRGGIKQRDTAALFGPPPEQERERQARTYRAPEAVWLSSLPSRRRGHGSRASSRSGSKASSRASSRRGSRPASRAAARREASRSILDGASSLQSSESLHRGTGLSPGDRPEAGPAPGGGGDLLGPRCNVTASRARNVYGWFHRTETAGAGGATERDISMRQLVMRSGIGSRAMRSLDTTGSGIEGDSVAPSGSGSDADSPLGPVASPGPRSPVNPFAMLTPDQRRSRVIRRAQLLQEVSIGHLSPDQAVQAASAGRGKRGGGGKPSSRASAPALRTVLDPPTHTPLGASRASRLTAADLRRRQGYSLDKGRTPEAEARYQRRRQRRLERAALLQRHREAVVAARAAGKRPPPLPHLPGSPSDEGEAEEEEEDQGVSDGSQRARRTLRSLRAHGTVRAAVGGKQFGRRATLKRRSLAAKEEVVEAAESDTAGSGARWSRGGSQGAGLQLPQLQSRRRRRAQRTGQSAGSAAPLTLPELGPGGAARGSDMEEEAGVMASHDTGAEGWHVRQGRAGSESSAAHSADTSGDASQAASLGSESEDIPALDDATGGNGDGATRPSAESLYRQFVTLRGIGKKTRGAKARKYFFRLLHRVDRWQEAMQAQLSPRSQYLADCKREALVPEPMGALARDQGTSLDLSMYGLGDAYAQAMRAQQLAHVRNINLRGNHLTSRGVEALTSGLHERVERLNLSDNAMGAVGVRALSEWIRTRGTKLASLTLENVGLTERSAAQLMAVLSRRPSLQRLNVSRNYLGVRGAAALVDLIQTSSTLKELYTSWVGFGARSAVSVAEGIRENNALRALDLSWNNLFAPVTGSGDAAAEAFSEALSNNISLQHLDISFTGLRAHQVPLLNQGLNNNHTLLGLHVGGVEAEADAKGFLLPRVARSQEDSRAIERDMAVHAHTFAPLSTSEAQMRMAALEEMGSSVGRGGTAEGVEVAEEEAVQVARAANPEPPQPDASDQGRSSNIEGHSEQQQQQRRQQQQPVMAEDASSTVSSDSETGAVSGAAAIAELQEADAVGDESRRRSQLMMHQASLVRRGSALMAESAAASPERAPSRGTVGTAGSPTAMEEGDQEAGGSDGAERDSGSEEDGKRRTSTKAWASARLALTSQRDKRERTPAERMHTLWLQVLGMALSGSRFAQSLRSVRARRQVGMNSAGDGLAAAKAIGEDEEDVSGRSVNRGCWVCERWCETEFKYTPGSSGPGGSEVCLHLDIDNYQPSPMERVEAGAAVLRRMVPPGRIYHHFSVDGKSVVARDQPRHFRVTELNFVDAPHDTERVLRQVCGRNDVPNFPTPQEAMPRPLQHDPLPISIGTEVEPGKRWTFRDSVFAACPRDTPSILMASFEADWRHAQSKMERLVADEEDSARVQSLLRDRYSILRDTFRFYAGIGSGDPTVMDFASFAEFALQCGAVDSGALSADDVDGIFRSANVTTVRDPRNPSKALTRFQFLEAVVRLAAACFAPGVGERVGDAVRLLLTECIEPYAERHDASEFHSEHLWQRDPDLEFRARWADLEAVFDRYCVQVPATGEKKHITLDRFFSLVMDAGLMDAGMDETEVKLAFALSVTTVEDQLASDRCRQLTMPEFLDAIGRLAAMKRWSDLSERRGLTRPRPGFSGVTAASIETEAGHRCYEATHALLERKCSQLTCRVDGRTQTLAARLPEHLERSFGQLLSVHEGSYLSFDKDKPLASSLNAVLEALCATTKLPEGESWLNRSMNFLARQRGSSKNLWDFQEGSAAR